MLVSYKEFIKIPNRRVCGEFKREQIELLNIQFGSKSKISQISKIKKIQNFKLW